MAWSAQRAPQINHLGRNRRFNRSCLDRDDRPDRRCHPRGLRNFRDSRRCVVSTHTPNTESTGSATRSAADTESLTEKKEGKMNAKKVSLLVFLAITMLAIMACGLGDLGIQVNNPNPVATQKYIVPTSTPTAFQPGPVATQPWIQVITATEQAITTPNETQRAQIQETLAVPLATQVVTAIPTRTPTQTPSPTATPLPTAVVTPTIQVYDYTPGGEGFGKWATDVVHPDGYAQGECGRVWQATNLENLPWVSMFCRWQVSDPTPKLQWPHPTQLTVSGNGTVQFELWRDHGADSSNPSPYDVANVKNSPLGLGWFVQGFNAEICVNGACQKLDGGGVFQIGFPEDFQGHYDIVITVTSGQANFWQGEKLTSVDNWPIP